MEIKEVIGKIEIKYKIIPIQVKLALWLTFCTLVQKGITVLTVPIFTRLMDTADYGRVSAYFSWLNIASIICSFKLNAGVYNKGLSKYKDDQEGYCLAMQYTTSLITIVVYFVYLIFHTSINKFTEMGTFITSLMFLEILFSTSMGFWSVRKQYLFQYKPVVLATLLYAFINPILGLLFVLNTSYEERGTARICSTVLAQVLVGAFFYIVNIKKGKYKFRKEYSYFAIIFNLPLIPHYFSEYILNQSDRIMIQKMCSYTQVAFYSVAYNAGMLMTIITSSLNQVMTPWLYQSLDNEELDQISKVLISLAIIIMLPTIVFIALAPEALYILAGTEYISSVYAIPPVAGSVVFLFLYTNFANIEFYYNYNKFTMYISMAGAVLNVVLNCVFIKIFGYVAAGYTTFACYLVYCVGHYIFVEHIIKKNLGRQLIKGKYLVILFTFLLVIMLLMSVTYKWKLFRYGIIALLLLCVVINYKSIVNVLKIVKRN